jgi:U4/U6 small nuclear ribonucleoprotein PRP31
MQIEKHSKIPRKSEDIVGPVESDPEYQLIVEANNMAVDIDNEIGSIIDYISLFDLYSITCK